MKLIAQQCRKNLADAEKLIAPLNRFASGAGTAPGRQDGGLAPWPPGNDGGFRPSIMRRATDLPARLARHIQAGDAALDESGRLPGDERTRRGCSQRLQRSRHSNTGSRAGGLRGVESVRSRPRQIPDDRRIRGVSRQQSLGIPCRATFDVVRCRGFERELKFNATAIPAGTCLGHWHRAR